MYRFVALLELKQSKLQLFVQFLLVFQLLAKLIRSFFTQAKLPTVSKLIIQGGSKIGL